MAKTRGRQVNKRVHSVDLGDEAARVEAYMQRVRGSTAAKPASGGHTSRPAESPPGQRRQRSRRPPADFARYNLLRRLINPNHKAQVNLQFDVGRLILGIPELHSVRLRKPGEIMIPILGRWQLWDLITENPDVKLDTMLEQVRAELGVRANNPRDVAAHEVHFSYKLLDPAPHLAVKGVSRAIGADRIAATAAFRQITGIQSDRYSKHAMLLAPIAEFPKGRPENPNHLDSILQMAAYHFPADSRVTFGPIEVVDLQNDAGRYLSIADLMNPG